MYVCEATLLDIPDLCILLHTLFSQEAEFSPDTNVQYTALEMIIKDETVGKILVLKYDEKIIGMVSLLFTISTALGGRVALLEDMVIDPAYRSQGAGSKLLNEALVYAKALTCKRVTLLSDSDNLDAHRFYKRFGFEDSLMKPMRLYLPINI